MDRASSCRRDSFDGKTRREMLAGGLFRQLLVNRLS